MDWTLNNCQHLTGDTIMQRVATFSAWFVLGLSLLATFGCDDKSADKKSGDQSSKSSVAANVSPTSAAKTVTKDKAAPAAPTAVPTEATAEPATEPSATAQIQITGVPGSPSATTTIDGRQLPAPDPQFGGVIKDNAVQSKPWWPSRVVPPEGAPNVLLIMTDDVGFAAPSTFGGVIPTPALDRLAKTGLRYTNFHSTSLCSPTRTRSLPAAIITRSASASSPRRPPASPVMTVTSARTTPPSGDILLDNGYRTSWFGKDHNTPSWTASQAGPFDQWPMGMGFEYFYGFVGGDTSQWEPNLFRNTTAIYPYVGKPGWNLTTAMADDAIQWLNQLNNINPKLPFFLHYVPGGTHAPHHPTPEWIKKISDMHLFDEGWNKLRETIIANQKKLGVIPQDTKLTPWPDDLLKEWNSLKPEEKKLFIRQADVYAAYLAYTDHEIGRVIQAVEDMGKLDNTLIIYISGDNGSSAEGSPNGTPSEVLQFNGIETAGGRTDEVLRCLGLPGHLQPYGRGLDLGFRHPFPLDEADSLLLRWDPPGHVHLLARPHQRQGRHPPPVPSRH